MKNPLKKIEKLIPILPEKDAKLADKFLKGRNFQGILELVESDMYKARKVNNDEEVLTKYEESLLELKAELLSYMSYTDFSDDIDDYNYY